MDQFHQLKSAGHKPNRHIGLLILGIFVIVAVFGLALYNETGAPLFLSLNEHGFEEQEFQEYLEKYSKKYENEYEIRFRIFRENLSFIKVHNKLGKEWTLGLNKFTDWSVEEFKEVYLSSELSKIDNDEHFYKESLLDVPTTVDWRLKGAVNAIKDQGQCGSCWAFSTTSSTEAAWFLSGKPLVSLSEQVLIDCSKSYGTNGCYGGHYSSALKYTVANGLPLSSVYPYKAISQACNNTAKLMTAAKITKSIVVYPNDKISMLNAVAARPISVAVQADQAVFQFYTGGVVTGSCGTNLNHAVNVVGYNLGVLPNYWIVRNTWGT